VSGRDDPPRTGDATAARMIQVIQLETALPRPSVRLRYFAADDTVRKRTNSTSHSNFPHWNYTHLIIE